MCIRDSLVTVGDEVKNIRDYIKIIKMRFGDRIRIHLDYDISVSGCHIPALVCQPLVENSVIHGMGSRTEGGNIWLRIKKDEDRLEISVRDDGRGMAREKLEQIRNTGKEGMAGVVSNGIGLSNVCLLYTSRVQERKSVEDNNINQKVQNRRRMIYEKKNYVRAAGRTYYCRYAGGMPENSYGK